MATMVAVHPEVLTFANPLEDGHGNAPNRVPLDVDYVDHKVGAGSLRRVHCRLNLDSRFDPDGGACRLWF